VNCLVFWEECAKFLSEEVGSAVDDRRHGQITHLARAISVHDLVEQVKSHCPPDTLIPSTEWVRFQFWPKSPAAKSSLQYTGRFRMKLWYNSDSGDIHTLIAIMQLQHFDTCVSML